MAAFTAKPLKHRSRAVRWLLGCIARDRPRLTLRMQHPTVALPFLPSPGPAMGCIRSLGRGPCLSTPLQVLVFLELRPSRAPHPLTIFALPPRRMPKGGRCREQLPTPRSIPASHLPHLSHHLSETHSQEQQCCPADRTGIKCRLGPGLYWCGEGTCKRIS